MKIEILLYLTPALATACADESSAAPANAASSPESLDASAYARMDSVAGSGLDAGDVEEMGSDASAILDDSGLQPLPCEGLTLDQCPLAVGCREVFAASIDEIINCAADTLYVGCKQQGDGCSPQVTYALAPDGSRWEVPDSCLPPRWVRTPGFNGGLALNRCP